MIRDSCLVTSHEARGTFIRRFAEIVKPEYLESSTWAMGKFRRQFDANKPPAATLLVVDDEPQNVDLMVDVFENAGYAAIGAGSGAEALEKIRIHRPDAVLLDLIMPGMDGFEVLRRLRADADIRHTPVMVITAMHVDEAGRDFLALNAQSIFQKGAFWIEDLLKGVERIIAQARDSRDARRASS